VPAPRPQVLRASDAGRSRHNVARQRRDFINSPGQRPGEFGTAVKSALKARLKLFWRTARCSYSRFLRRIGDHPFDSSFFVEAVRQLRQLPNRLTAEFRRNGNLEWDLPTDVIWWDERMHVLLGAAVSYVALGRKPARGEAPVTYRHDDVGAESLMPGIDRRSTRND
jgi:hypothetical protein